MLTNLFSTCHNRVQQQPIKVKLQVFKTEKRGWGIRALHDIPQVKHNIYLILKNFYPAFSFIISVFVKQKAFCFSRGNQVILFYDKPGFLANSGDLHKYF